MTGGICATPGCGAIITSTHPKMWDKCAACYCAPSPALLAQRARDAKRPTVGRVRLPMPQIMLAQQVRPYREPRARSGETPEHAVLSEVQEALGGVPGLLVMRNSVGMATRAGGGRLPYGLGVGSTDLVGILAPRGRWLAWEVKAPEGRATPAQLAWIARVEALGGVAGVVRSAAEALAVVERAR